MERWSGDLCPGAQGTGAGKWVSVVDFLRGSGWSGSTTALRLRSNRGGIGCQRSTRRRQPASSAGGDDDGGVVGPWISATWFPNGRRKAQAPLFTSPPPAETRHGKRISNFFFWAKHEAYYIHSFYRNCYATEEREMKPFFDCESNMTTTIKYAWLVASIVWKVEK
jgi:hypothetical protein